MKKLQFEINDYSVLFNNEKIRLLPKEYHLLKCLYENMNQTLSRQSLLDKVWAMEDPTDRTIDDHVYRLRKKLSFLDDILIETVRGVGYRLTLKQNHQDNPLYHDKEFRESMDVLYNKYILYGQANGLKTIVMQHEALDIPIEVHKKIYLHFVQGDFQWFVTSSDIPLSQKLFYLLHIYWMIQFNIDKTYAYVQKALRLKMIPFQQQQELEELAMIGINIDKGNFEDTKKKINLVRSQIEQGAVHESILTYLKIQEIKNKLLTRNFHSVETHMAEGDQLFEKYPFLREKGRFLMLKGFTKWMKGYEKEALQQMDEGFMILLSSKFVPHIINGVRDIILLSNHLAIDLPHDYKNKWESFSEKYDFPRLTVKIEQLLNKCL
ncbi:winged helix-turn-helix domain-containing protein [Bacillus sp. FJAT-29953]|nr:winged helix-turn-helix domain-containing protein [Bacillus sp. FJAT-29953]